MMVMMGMAVTAVFAVIGLNVRNARFGVMIEMIAVRIEQSSSLFLFLAVNRQSYSDQNEGGS